MAGEPLRKSVLLPKPASTLGGSDDCVGQESDLSALSAAGSDVFPPSPAVSAPLAAEAEEIETCLKPLTRDEADEESAEDSDDDEA